VREPGPPFTAIGTKAFQPVLDVPGEQRRMTAGVLEDEHADTPRLAIAARCETDLSRAGRSVAQCLEDRVELAGRTMPEERKRDMQVLPRDDANARELRVLPPLDVVEHVVGQAEREEEP